MNKTILWIRAAALTAALVTVLSCGESKAPWNKVTLTMTTWWPEEIVPIRSLLAEYRRIKPQVEIRLQTIPPAEYESALETQMKNGTGPNLMFARSYQIGEEFFQAGYFADCGDIPGIRENFNPNALAPWQTSDGKLFGLPFAAVSHGVYYNRTIFREEGLLIPNTWEEFLTLCETLKSRGYTPLANGIADGGYFMETFFLGILPNFVGGASERNKYESRMSKLNSSNMVAAFQATADIAGYLPKDFKDTGYREALALFKNREAAMLMDGSWNIGVYENALFEWGVFAMPAPKGRKTLVTFHPDVAITYNPAAERLQESREFLEWLVSSEGAIIATRTLPLGFFPMIDLFIQPMDVHATEFFTLAKDRETDVRFIWPSMIHLHATMTDMVTGVVRGDKTPRQAADSLEKAMTILTEKK
ncbi:MAG: extracellular solute-binding protein [Treponema sp.]|jgi:raffinose/stachyose/melibiose transport system substrate-binding protein|nr:extracellular solute-binding protein [Treponema sp.]